MRLVSRFSRTLIDFILPQNCILCNTETPDSLICTGCLEYLPVVRSPWCCICGRPVVDLRVCSYCTNEVSIDHGRAWLRFVPPTDTLIHHFKYCNKTHLAVLLGRALSSIILSDPVLIKADIVVPVPLFWFKRMLRGYNQAKLLAHEISTNTGIAQENVLRRIRHTRTQTRLSDTARHKNMIGAFTVCSTTVTDKRVLLVDDVMTTGATANECARVLKQAGAKAVYICVAAITL